jgi:acyl-CoA thioesterase-2
VPFLAQDPTPLRARAVWDGVVVAESAAPVRLVADGVPAVLGFPANDVRWDLLSEEPADAGPGQLYSLDGTSPHPRSRARRAAGAPDVVDGRGAVRRDPASGLVVLDHDRVRVELLDGEEGAEPRDVTVKQFPVWGDLSDLLRLMDVQREADGSWTGVAAGHSERPVTEASQMLGQALVAAVRQSGGRRPVSAHMAFFRVADARRPLRFELEELSAGRTFTTVAVRVLQDGRPRAAGTLLLDVTAPDVVQHQEPAPPCPGPYESVPYDMGVLGRDLRVVDAAYTDDPGAPVGPPVVDAWLRFRDVPEDPALHVGLLAQFAGHMSIAAAMRPHEGVGQAQAHVTLSTGINAIHLSLHREVRVDEWVRYHHHATSVQGGMAHAQNAAYDEQGTLLASFSVEAMLRGFGDDRSRDARTAM